VLDVEKGWYGASESNTVKYDADQVTMQQLESWLKKSGTYIRTIPLHKDRSEAAGEK
jgi:hypothetical protein